MTITPGSQQESQYLAALFNQETAIWLEKRHPYPANLNSHTPGDSKSAYLPWADVSAPFNPENVYFSSRDVVPTLQI